MRFTIHVQFDFQFCVFAIQFRFSVTSTTSCFPLFVLLCSGSFDSISCVIQKSWSNYYSITISSFDSNSWFEFVLRLIFTIFFDSSRSRFRIDSLHRWYSNFFLVLKLCRIDYSVFRIVLCRHCTMWLYCSLGVCGKPSLKDILVLRSVW